MSGKYKATQSGGTIQRISDGAFIPVDTENPDYRAFLASGETLDAADVPAPVTVLSATTFLDRLGADGPALFSSPFGFALIRLAAAGSIDVSDPQVIGGMQAAVDAGAITSQRAAELLAP